MTSLAVSSQELLEGIRFVGIEPSSTVYVASSLAALGLMDDPVHDTLRALRESISSGTIVMPAFNFAFCRGEMFCREDTPSDCGVLAETFRTSNGAARTSSPPYHTVAAAGALAADIAKIESPTSFGRESVFQFLHDIDAWQLLIGCGYDEGVAHFHWLEELLEVPYRFWKKFDGDVRVCGETRRRSFFMYARRLDVGVELDADPAGAEFEQAGYVRVCDVGLCRLRAFRLQDFYAYFAPRMRADPLLLLTPESHRRVQRPATPVTRVHHVAVVSRYADQIRGVCKAAGLDLAGQGIVERLGVECQYFDGMNVNIEFVDPVREESCVSGYLRRGAMSPLHHVAFEVTGLDEGLQYFKERGYAPLDGQVHLGPAPGQRVIFLSPATTGGLLVELVAGDATAADGLGGTGT